MACGGIYPWYTAEATELKLKEVEAVHRECRLCHESNAKHFVEEYSAFIHARCVGEFLMTDDLVVNHGHQVFLDFSLDEVPVVVLKKKPARAKSA